MKDLETEKRNCSSMNLDFIEYWRYFITHEFGRQTNSLSNRKVCP